MTDAPVSRSHGNRILFGTTVGMSAMALLRGQLAWFREQGWEVTLVTTPDVEAKQAVRREKVSFQAISMKREISLLHDLKALVVWIRLLRRVRPNVVNLGTPKASLLGIVAAWVCRVPRRIYTVRGLRLEGSSGLLTKLLWLIERLIIKLSTDVVVVSPSLGKELIQRRLAAPNDLWLIGHGSSNGVDSSAIQERIANIDQKELKQQLGIDPDTFVVGYVGRVNASKGVGTLVDALRHESLVGDVDLLVIGTVEDETFQEALSSLKNQVHIVPWTNDVWGYLPAIDLLVLPTLREGFPNTVLEAAAAGIPTVTTRATGAIDSVIEGQTGFLIEVNDVKSLVERIKTLEKDRELLRFLGTNARERTEKQFRPQGIWSGIEAIALGNYESARLERLHPF